MKIDRKMSRMCSMIGSTGTFGIAMNELAKEYQDMCVVTADLEVFSGLERFRHQFPEKIYNVGIAEQNLLGVAAGLASEGIKIFAATYASFASTRALDQVRISMGYMKIPVKLVGLTAGLSAGILGATHMALEDIAIMRAIPNITILSPADCMETIKCMEAALEYPHPVYIRLTGAKRMPMVYQEDYQYEIGKAVLLKEGRDICILATGSMVYSAMKIGEKLEQSNISASVYNVHTIKPLDQMLIEELKKFSMIVTMEEHSVTGGLGGAIAEVLTGWSSNLRLLHIGVEDYYPRAGTYNHLLDEVGLSEDKMLDKVVDFYNKA